PDDVTSVEVAVLAQARTDTHDLDRVRADAIRPYRRENRLKQRGEHANPARYPALLGHDGLPSFSDQLLWRDVAGGPGRTGESPEVPAGFVVRDIGAGDLVGLHVAVAVVAVPRRCELLGRSGREDHAR